MYKNNLFLAIVPARGGSKGIPHKNIVHIKGRPLISYTLDAAKQSEYLDEIYVSTDDEEIADVARQQGIKVLYRPDALATDTSKTIDVLMHAVKEKGKCYDYTVLLQPTQPMRKAWHIDQAIEETINNNYHSLVSISKVKKHPILIRRVSENHKLVPLLNMSSTVRRQDFEPYYVVNGAIYINKIKELCESTSLNDNEYGYLMDERYDVDIDDELDLLIFEKMLERNNRE